jgi:hypothetical protein
MFLFNYLNSFITFCKKYFCLKSFLIILILVISLFVLIDLESRIRSLCASITTLSDQVYILEAEIRHLEALAKTASEAPVSLRPVLVEDDYFNYSLVIDRGLLLIGVSYLFMRFFHFL